MQITLLMHLKQKNQTIYYFFHFYYQTKKRNLYKSIVDKNSPNVECSDQNFKMMKLIRNEENSEDFNKQIQEIVQGLIKRRI